MPNTTNKVVNLRMEVISRIAKLFWEEKLVEEIDKIPYIMRPRDFKEMSRCCLYKDRAILRDRILAILGVRLEDHPDDSIPLAHFAEKALVDSQPNWPFLTVCDVACHGCGKARYFVSDACQNCVARSCQSACHFGAISIVNGRSFIDPNKCRNCGMCHAACPYQAIVHLNVPCEGACPVQCIHKGESGRAEIDFDKCTSCGRCMQACPFGAVMERSEVLEVLITLSSSAHVTALVAPAIAGQFKGGLTRIVTALKKLGFDEVIEVAAGADVTSEREAREFVERMQEGKSFMTTSCCPAYVEAVRRHAPELLPYVSNTKTPMHYTAEISRQRNPETVNVFIGPCVAKRTEGLNDPLIDFVLTFSEVEALFISKDIDVATCEEAELEHPSGAGRGYAITGGVAAAVKKMVGDKYEVKPILINGLTTKALKTMVAYTKGKCPGNLIEVMTCPGGCVGGAGVFADPASATRLVDKFAQSSPGAAPRILPPTTK